ncbi:hypothetical protein KQI77_02040 [Clostridium sp. MSJ-8]|uniref:hypothetical protein n=1 Tax=Clostridium sp. MSJ-8 TaxID=2841510 RepID=UPI001C0F2863|nr:hypothetical protein [Clostridium sp. MSJ-8]MBU5486945.1 hypothetical protein [Clostridium sp. MSJ-8]
MKKFNFKKILTIVAVLIFAFTALSTTVNTQKVSAADYTVWRQSAWNSGNYRGYQYVTTTFKTNLTDDYMSRARVNQVYVEVYGADGTYYSTSVATYDENENVYKAVTGYWGFVGIVKYRCVIRYSSYTGKEQGPIYSDWYNFN